MRADLLEIYAKEKFELPEGWKVRTIEGFPPPGAMIEDLPAKLQKCLYVIMTGAVAPLVTRGKRKGRLNWQKRDRSTQAKVLIEILKYEAWAQEWERQDRTARYLRSLDTAAS